MRIGKRGFWRRNIGLAFILPWLIGFAIFKMYPFLASLFYSFHDYNMFKSASFIGLKNYETILNDKLIMKAFDRSSMIFHFQQNQDRSSVSLAPLHVESPP